MSNGDLIDGICRICGSTFKAKTNRRGLCDICQKDPARAQEKIDMAIRRSKIRMGEMPWQQARVNNPGPCNQCGKQGAPSFGPHSGFCDHSCRKQYMIKTAKCKICGELLFPLGIEAKNGAGFCCEEHAEQYRWKKAEEKGNITHCEYCKKEFIGPVTKMYCSNECYKKHRNEKASAHCYSPVKSVIITKNCEICNIEFKCQSYSNKLTCSDECRKIRNEYIKKEKSEVKKAEKEKILQDNQEENDKMLDKALFGKLPEKDMLKLHLCTQCKTSQTYCEMFTSNFIKCPPEAKTKLINGKRIVLICPKHRK